MRSFVPRLSIAVLILCAAASGAMAGSSRYYCRDGYYYDSPAARFRNEPYTFYAQQFVPLWLPRATAYRPWVADVLAELRAANRRLDWSRAHCLISLADYARLKNDIGRIRVEALGNAEIYRGAIPSLQYISLRHDLNRLWRML